jgi:hypothetical protein
LRKVSELLRPAIAEIGDFLRHIPCPCQNCSDRLKFFMLVL